MSKLLGVTIITFLLLQFSCGNLVESLKNLNFPDSKWEDVEKLTDSGEMRGFFYLSEVNEMLAYLREKCAKCISPIYKLGETWKGNNITVYALTNDPADDIINSTTKPAIFFNSLHHAREAPTLNFIVYITLKWVVGCMNNDPVIKKMFDHTVVWFFPVVNIDGYTRINEIYHDTNQLTYIRKNLHSTAECYPELNNGVDLNRNYDFKFAGSEDGSETGPCAETYRGPSPFSEPETKAVRDFLQNHPNVKVSLNFHCWGNLWITPFNSDPNRDNVGLNSNKTARNIYEEIKLEGKMSRSAVTGNAMQTVGYPANGEASDWMFGTLKIIALSPELGTDDQNSESFFPAQGVILGILKNNYPTVEYIYNKLLHDILTDYDMWVQNTKETTSNTLKTKKYILQIFNKGLSELSTSQLQIDAQNYTAGTLKPGDINVAYVLITENEYFNDTNKNTNLPLGKFQTKPFPEGKLPKHTLSISDIKSNRNLTFDQNIIIPGRTFLQMEIGFNVPLKTDMLFTVTLHHNADVWEIAQIRPIVNDTEIPAEPENSENKTDEQNNNDGNADETDQVIDSEDDDFDVKDFEFDPSPDDQDTTQHIDGQGQPDDFPPPWLLILIIIACVGLVGFVVWLYCVYRKNSTLTQIPSIAQQNEKELDTSGQDDV